MILYRRPWVAALAVTLLLLLANLAVQPSLFKPAIMLSNLSSWLPLILVAMGQTYVVLSGDIDLSIGAIISLVNVSVVSLIGAFGGGDGALLLAIVCGFAIGIGAGAINGVFVAALRLQPIVTTFGTGILFAGLALAIMPDAGGTVPDRVFETYAGPLLGVPVILWILSLAVLFVIALGRTRFGLRALAVGGDAQAAFQTGLPVTRVRILNYGLAGGFAALAALCLIGETATGDPLLGGSYTLSSISALVLGGTALSGGTGGAIGSLFGAMSLGIINNVIFFARLPFELQSLIQGIIVLAALAVGTLVARR